MKKKFTFLFLFTFVLFSNAQITITHQSLPQPGDTFAMRYSHYPVINIGTPLSTSQHFDFSDLENDSLKFATYGITSQLPFANEYPESNLYTWGPSVLYGGPGTPVPGVAWGWMLFKTDVDGMSVVGYRTGDAPNILTANQTPPLVLMKTPFTYGNSHTQNSHWSVYLDSNPADVDTIYTSFANSNLLCDAWGTITTPTDQNMDVIRIREYKISVDSIYGKIGSMIVWKTELRRDTVLNYQFYSPSKRHPIVTIFCQPDETVYGVQYLWYSDLYNSIESNIEKSINCFPNPVQNYIYIEGSSLHSYYEIIDLQGKTVLHGQLAISNIIDLSSLKSGIYFLSIRNSSEKYLKKIIKN